MTELEQIAKIIADLGTEARMAFVWWLFAAKVVPYLLPCSLLAFIATVVKGLVTKAINNDVLENERRRQERMQERIQERAQ